MDEPFYVSPFSSPAGTPMLRAWRSAENGSYRLLHWDGVDCTVSADGHHVRMTSSGSSADPDEFLAGTVLALAWRLRGELCLHASAVSIGGRAVLFVGESGAGKSTIAAALAVRGHRVIADDLVVISADHEARAARSEGVHLRLRQSGVALLERFAERRLPWRPSPSGEYMDLDVGPAPGEPAPIEILCFLHRESATRGRLRMADIGGADTAMALIFDSWASRLQDRALRQQEFEHVTRLVHAVRAIQLRCDDGRSLHSLVNVIEREREYASATQ